MANVSKKSAYTVFSVLVIAAVVFLGAFVSVAHAYEDLGYYGTSDNLGYYGTSDLGYYGASDDLGYYGTSDLGYYGASDLGYYGTSDLGYYGASDDLGYYGTSDLGYYGTSDNLGYYGTDSFDLGYYGASDNLGYYDASDLGYYGASDNVGYYGTSDLGYYGASDNLGYYGTSDNLGYYGTNDVVEDFYGSETTHSVVDEYGVEYTEEYYNDYAYSYSSGCGSSCGKSYTTPGCSYCYTSTPPKITAPKYSVSYPPVVIPPSKPSNNSTVVNTNTCTHGSCNTSVNNIDNSINGSFNTTAPVNPVVYPQPLVQHVFPQQFPQQPIRPGNVCTITAAPTSIQNGQPSYLTWRSNPGVFDAWMSDGIGRVAPNGTLIVRPNVSTNYVLNVQGPAGPATCNVFVNVSGSYVSLTQIPYTGFDLGIMGTMIYWLGLITFAASGAYLALYYKGGASVFTSSIFGGMKLAKSNVQPKAQTGSLATPNMFAREARSAFTPTKSASRALENLPVARSVEAPKSSISFLKSEKEHETPRIVITSA